MFWVIIIVILVLIIITLLVSLSQNKKLEDDSTWENELPEELRPVGTYIGGHPDMDRTVTDCYVYIKEYNFEFYKKIMMENPIYFFSIHIELVKSIEIKNLTEIEDNIREGRLVLVGDFAEDWERKRNEEMTFLSIKWVENGKNYTTFCFEGENSVQEANTARNNLLKLCDM